MGQIFRLVFSHWQCTLNVCKQSLCREYVKTWQLCKTICRSMLVQQLSIAVMIHISLSLVSALVFSVTGRVTSNRHRNSELIELLYCWTD